MRGANPVDARAICGEGLTFDRNRAHRLRSLRTFVLGDKGDVDKGITFGLSGGRGVQTLVNAGAIYGEGITFDHNRAHRFRSLRTFVLEDEGDVDEGITFGLSGGRGVQTLVDVEAICGEGLTFDRNRAHRLRSLRIFVLGDEGDVDEGVAFGLSGR